MTTTILTVKFRRNTPEARLPSKAHESDACFDLYAAESEDIFPGDTVMVNTGFDIAIPEEHVGLVCSRSGNASRGLVVANAPGIVDAGYRGPLKVILHNNSEDVWHVGHGDRIAQLMVQKVLPTICTEVYELDLDTDRGTGGFGSSGK